ncbi:hypothetical protein DFP72DRAFT_481746 [Ephemerocybe angulata]|uniref:F-box domain-containing protein n=1 Tax=Ephemerocybe angulata TaxID=980116 RepID=A0A8H6IDR5_9AGAR|nr:hypothetical protein DFP72DRAFT_481746 [Tulosesus angulatus]
MHQALQIPEIIRTILEGSNTKKALAVALTCRAFLEPGLDRVWHTLRGFTEIVSCFPEDLCEVERRDVRGLNGNPTVEVEVLVLRRALKVADLERYLTKYSHRIRVFTGINTRLFFLSNEVSQALQMATEYRPGALSPHLETFYWPFFAQQYETYYGRECSAMVSAFVPLLLSSTVASFCLPYFEIVQPITSTTIQLALSRLRLTKLNVLTGAHVSWVQEVLQGPLGNQLRNLRLNIVTSPQLLVCVKALPQLRYLHLGVVGNLLPLNAALTTELTIPFPSLLNFTFFAKDYSKVAAILELIPTTNGIRHLGFTVDNPGIKDEVRETIDIIRVRMNPWTLASLRWVERGGPRQAPQTVPIDVDIHGSVDISPLFLFKNLTRFKISIQEPVQLSPNQVDQIPLAWPTIQSLKVRSPGRNHLAPLIDYEHILSLIDGCRSLRKLSLPFDTTRLAGNETSPGAPYSLETLQVDDCPIYSPTRVVAFLKANFRKTTTITRQTPEDAGERSLFCQRWDIVEKEWAAYCST